METFSPQFIIDEINESLVIADSGEDQAAQASLALQKLRIVKRSLSTEKARIKASWDGRNKHELLQEQIELQPYDLVESYLLETELYLNQLKKNGSGIPFSVVETIFGEAGNWQLGSKLDALRWQLKRKHDELLRAIEEEKGSLLMNKTQLEKVVRERIEAFDIAVESLEDEIVRESDTIKSNIRKAHESAKTAQQERNKSCGCLLLTILCFPGFVWASIEGAANLSRDGHNPTILYLISVSCTVIGFLFFIGLIFDYFRRVNEQRVAKENAVMLTSDLKNLRLGVEFKKPEITEKRKAFIEYLQQEYKTQMTQLLASHKSKLGQLEVESKEINQKLTALGDQ